MVGKMGGFGLFGVVFKGRLIRNIDVSKQYECVWLDTVPNNDIFYNTVKTDDKKRRGVVV